MNDHQDHELIARLCTQAGTIMEDASVLALKVGSVVSPERAMAIQNLEIASRCISALINAVMALSE